MLVICVKYLAKSMLGLSLLDLTHNPNMSAVTVTPAVETETLPRKVKSWTSPGREQGFQLREAAECQCATHQPGPPATHRPGPPRRCLLTPKEDGVTPEGFSGLYPIHPGFSSNDPRVPSQHLRSTCDELMEPVRDVPHPIFRASLQRR